jgi:hypothetical protein
MKPLFTIHEGEFLVGDHINRKLGKKYDVWVPTKDSGIDLLVTRKDRRGRAVGLQVKFSRSFPIREEFSRHLLATSWFTLDPKKVRESRADLWVFVILTLRHEAHFIVISTNELRERSPRGTRGKWNLYLWVFDDRTCYQVRDLSHEERLDVMRRGIDDAHLDYSEWLDRWELLGETPQRRR